MTQSALTWHPTATVRNTSTLKLRSVLSTLWFRSCEMQRCAILFLQLLIRVISLRLSAPLSQSTMSLTVLRVSKEFMILLMGGSFIIRSSLTVIQTRTQSFHSPPRATTHFSKYAYVYRCRMTHYHYLMSWPAVVVLAIFISIPSESKVMTDGACWIVYVEQKWESGQLYLETCMWAMFAVFNEAFGLAVWQWKHIITQGLNLCCESCFGVLYCTD